MFSPAHSLTAAIVSVNGTPTVNRVRVESGGWVEVGKVQARPSLRSVVFGFQDGWGGPEQAEAGTANLRPSGSLLHVNRAQPALSGSGFGRVCPSHGWGPWMQLSLCVCCRCSWS